jgi:hypothetical protein
MRRSAPALLAAAALAVTACGSDEPATTTSNGLANLTVTLDNDGPKGQPAKELKLTCDRASDSPACKTVATITQSDLAPTPKDMACTMIFAGPETATITGTLRGSAVDAKFSRRDGCEVQRWKRVQPLLAEVR